MAVQQYDYSKLLGRMREKKYTQETLSAAIGMSAQSLNLRLNNKLPFKQDEIITILKCLDVPIEHVDAYFFCHQTLEI